MPTIPYDLLIQALVETLVMTAAAGAVSLLLGLPLGLALHNTAPGGLWQHRPLHRGIGGVVNAFRSMPFIILMVALIPLTRLIAGTSIGTTAAIVPLSIAAIPYYARVAQVSLREVDRGLVEAVQAMGGSQVTVMRDVLIPEALPGLISGFTVTLVLLIGASAMAGAIGAGGLGDLAIRYGYQRFNTPVMVAVIVVLVALVALIQAAGDAVARRVDHR